MRGEAEGLAIRILNARAGHIEAMTAAYLKLTDIPPDQAVLCEQLKDGVYRWWFERTTATDPARVARLESLLREIDDCLLNVNFAALPEDGHTTLNYDVARDWQERVADLLGREKWWVTK